ncbi:MAG TPA: response regulator, partial [Polyangia bacterium]|nr:response regulator [Polyangia bacterium]
IFDPFFTTKPPGIGTGLGLWICHGILAGMSGEISVASESGRGAVFRVTLPSVQLETTGVSPDPVPAEVPGQGARVLIIDDEPMIVSALRRSLGAEYNVTGLIDGREALARLERGERFDVILCDLMMPDLNGMDFYDELSRVAPDQRDRMIFVTGGAFTPRSREFLERVPNPRVEKPIDFQNLRSLIKNATR